MGRDNLTGDLNLDAICVEFEQSLRGDGSPRIEAILEVNPQVDDRKLVEQLIMVELEYLTEQGDIPFSESYVERFPQHRASIEAVFEALQARTTGATEVHSPSEAAGSAIGAYRLLEQIGEGGMGVVFMAEQTKPVRRKVALKIIKPGMDTKQVIARFEAERQALAMMDHPNIARVLDAGSTDSGRPYFVMELVRGIPITDYSDQNKLPTRERLELFVSVCQAVQHAHTKGIIHRDIKPSNVLVTHHDGVPIPKIIDFGVAKATNQQLTERTLFTAFAQLIGTPLYMSPEQAEMSGLDVDTRSDIYSLGVLLYELLTGTTPVDKKRMQTAAFDEIRRMIREEDPIKPSTAVSTLGDEANSISMRRGTDANKLRRSLAGELDWIVMKALEKDRTRRFQTANDFAEDVQRHLMGDAVEACPPTLGYQFGKFAKRYRAQVTVAALFLGLLVIATLVSSALFANARHARTDAEQATQREEAAKQTALAAEKHAIEQRDRAIEQQNAAETLAKRLNQNLYAFNLSKAAAAFRKDQQPQTRQFLARCDESSRGWEWHYLNNALEPIEYREIPGAPMAAAVLNSDGTKLAVVDTQQQLRIHDFQTGKLIWTREAQDPSIAGGYMEFSPDGRLIGAASSYRSQKGRITVCDVTTGDIVWQFDVGERVGTFRFSPDGTHIVFGRTSKLTTEYRRLSDDKLLWSYDRGRGFPLFDISPDGNRIYVNAVTAEDLSTPSILSCISTKDGGNVWEDVQRSTSSLAVVTPDGRRLLTNGPEATTIVRDANDGSEIERFESGHDKGWFFGILDPTGRYFATAGANHFVLYDLKNRAVVHREKSRVSVGVPPSFSSDGRSIINLRSHDTTRLEIHSTSPKLTRLTLRGHEEAVTQGTLSSDGRVFRSASLDGTVRTWSLASGLEQSLLDTGEAVHSLAESESYFATGHHDGVRLWDRNTNRPIYHFDECGLTFWMDFSKDGKRLVAGGKARGLTVFDLETRAPIAILDDVGAVGGLRFCNPTGTLVASLSVDQFAVRLWNCENDEVTTLTHNSIERSRGLAVSEDFTYLAVGNGAAVDVWDLDKRKLVHTLRGRDSAVTSVAFNQAATRIFAGARDGTLQVWDATSGEQYIYMEAHESVPVPSDNNRPHGVELVVAGSDGRSIVSCGADGVVRVWETTKHSPETEYQRRRVREASRLVNAEYQKSFSADEVVTRLMANSDIDKTVRQLALQIANERGDRPKAPFEVQKQETAITVPNLRDSYLKTKLEFRQFIEQESGVPIDHPLTTISPKGDSWFGQAFNLAGTDNFSLREIETITEPLIESYPEAHQPRFLRARAYAKYGLWKKASAEYDIALRYLDPESRIWFRIAYYSAPFHVVAGEFERYERICKLADDSVFSEDPRTAEMACKMVLLRPTEHVNPSAVADHVRKHPFKGNPHFYQLSLALAEYRCGDYQRALTEVELPCRPQVGNKFVSVPALALRAMVHFHLGNQEEAARDLSAAESAVAEPSYPPNDEGIHINPLDWLYAHAFLEEARGLVQESGR